MEIIEKFTPPSQDETMHELAYEKKSKYMASTSSVSDTLINIYHYYSHFKPPNLTSLSHYQVKDRPYKVFPSSIIIKPRKGSYAVDAYNAFKEQESKLNQLGKTLERRLTMTDAEFQNLLKVNGNKSVQLPPEYHLYKSIGPFLFRSQIDCAHPNLPGKFKFYDLKTRATQAIRIDFDQLEGKCSYTLSTLIGKEASYETEYFDLLVSKFMKYSFQMRIGNMAGVFLAYHNVLHLLGYEFVTAKEIDECLYGSPEMANKSYEVCLKLLSVILDEVTEMMPKVNIRLTLAPTRSSNALDIFVTKMGESGINSIEEPPKDGHVIYYLSKDDGLRESKRAPDPIWLQLTLSSYFEGNDCSFDENLPVSYQLKKVATTSEKIRERYAEVLRISRDPEHEKYHEK